MKKTLALFVATFLLCALALAGAETALSASEIYGKWNMTRYIVGDLAYDDPAAVGNTKSLEFNEDGTATVTINGKVYNADGTATVTINGKVYNAEWWMNDGILHLIYEDGDLADFVVEPDQLIYSTGSQIQYFTKAAAHRGLGDATSYKAFLFRGIYQKEFYNFDLPFPADWTTVEIGDGAACDTEDPSQAHYVLRYNVYGLDNPPEDDNEEGILEVYATHKTRMDSLIAESEDNSVEYFKINGHTAMLIYVTRHAEGERRDVAVAVYLRDGWLIEAVYSCYTGENEDDYTFNKDDLRLLAQKIRYNRD